MAVLVCQMCLYQTMSKIDFNLHVLKAHKNESTFFIKCVHQNCMYTTKNWKNFMSHIKSKHKNDASADNYNYTQDSDTNGQESGCIDVSNIDLLVARFLLDIESKHNVNNTCIDTVVSSTEQLLRNVLKNIITAVEKNFPGGTEISREFVLDVLKNIDGFQSFSTPYLREKFYTQNCYLVRPKEVLLGIHSKNINGCQKIFKDRGYIVPMREYLGKLLSLPEVFFYCFQNKRQGTELMQDFSDGLHVQSHEIFSEYSNALQIILYFDEITLSNVMRAKFREHKLCMFYFTLGNIPPEHRSVLHNIHLIGIIKSKHMKKYGLKKFFANFIDTINELRSDGIKMNLRGNNKIVRGDLLICQTDTPAGSILSSMKESHFAIRNCRLCNARQEEWSVRFRHTDFELRTIDTHQNRLKVIKDTNLSKTNRTLWSKLWGINGESVLAGIHNFDYLKCIPYDPFHIFLEGETDYIIALFLYRAIYTCEFFTIEWLNEAIDEYKFSYLDIKDKPTRFAKSDLERNTCKQTAAGIMIMAFTLPHILFWKIPANDRHYKHLINYIQITLLATSPYADKNTIGELEVRISKFYTEMPVLYANATIHPKAHQCAHLPFLIKQFGPGRLFWNMRMEAKHAYFKNIKWKNYINLPKSLSEKHQRFMANKMCSVSSTMNLNFLYSGEELPQGKKVNIQHDYEFLPMSLSAEIGVEVTEFKEIKFLGLKYKPGIAILLSWKDDWPTFGIIEAIWICSNEKVWFLVDLMESPSFKWHLNAFEIFSANKYNVIEAAKLINKFPLPISRHNERLFVTNRYCHFQISS